MTQAAQAILVVAFLEMIPLAPETYQVQGTFLPTGSKIDRQPLYMSQINLSKE